jgi:hypothetical protein
MAMSVPTTMRAMETRARVLRVDRLQRDGDQVPNVSWLRA